MAQKQKRLTRKERVQQRRAAIAQEHSGGGLPRSRWSKAELLADMAPLLPDGIPDSPEGMMDMMIQIVDTYDLVDEPEFESIIINPLRCVETFGEVSEELKLDLGELDTLSEEEEEDTYFQLLETTTQRLFTNELREELLVAVDTLRLRLKQTGRSEEVPKVAGLQMILTDRHNKALWPAVGLIQALVRRSLEAGFELADASAALAGSTGAEEVEETILEAQQKFETILERIPGLTGFLEQEADKIWQEGTEDVYEGRLFLDLFTLEERQTGKQIIHEVLENTTQSQLPGSKKTQGKLEAQEAREIIAQFDNYLGKILTPDRFAQFQDQLEILLEDEDLLPQRRAFLMMLSEDMAHEEGRDELRGFLIRTFFFETMVTEVDEDEMDE